MDLKYMPAIIIGCGGTGVRALRHIKAQSIYNHELKCALDSKKIQLLGIDSDPTSNGTVDYLDPYTLKNFAYGQYNTENFPDHLPKIDEFTSIKRERISLAIPSIRESIAILSANKDRPIESKIEHSSIAKWFPILDPKSPFIPGERYHSEGGGATQNRTIGRLGFFMHLKEIYLSIYNALDHYETVNNLSPKRVYVLCSLAGGTGSGMFWDVAFLLKAIDPNVIINGLFMLDGPYESIIERQRNKANVYAALQEIVKLHNWKIEGDYTINYPVGTDEIVYQASPGSSSAYKNIYLYQDFKPGENAADHSSAKIEASCYRLAANNIAMIRRDIHDISDANKNLICNESDLVFSTSSVVELNPPKIKSLEEHFFSRWLGRIRKQIVNKKQYEEKLKSEDVFNIALRGMLTNNELSSSKFDGGLSWSKVQVGTIGDLHHFFKANFLCNNRLKTPEDISLLRDALDSIENKILNTDDFCSEEEIRNLFIEYFSEVVNSLIMIKGVSASSGEKKTNYF